MINRPSFHIIFYLISYLLFYISHRISPTDLAGFGLDILVLFAIFVISAYLFIKILLNMYIKVSHKFVIALIHVVGVFTMLRT